MLNVEDFGAVSGGLIDNSLAFATAAAALKSYDVLLIPDGKTFLLKSTWNLNTLPPDVTILCYGKLKFFNSFYPNGMDGIALTNAKRTRIFIKHLEGLSWTTDTPDYESYVGSGLTLYNCWNCDVAIDYIIRFRTGVLFTGGGGSGSQYNTLTFKQMNICRDGIVFDCAADGWANENTVFGGQLSGYNGMTINGTNLPMPKVLGGNKAYNVGFENLTGFGVKLDQCSANIVVNPRFENITGFNVIETNTCQNNKIHMCQDTYLSKYSIAGKKTEIYGNLMDEGGCCIASKMITRIDYTTKFINDYIG
jgi:hypothetical protein